MLYSTVIHALQVMRKFRVKKNDIERSAGPVTTTVDGLKPELMQQCDLAGTWPIGKQRLRSSNNNNLKEKAAKRQNEVLIRHLRSRYIFVRFR